MRNRGLQREEMPCWADMGVWGWSGKEKDVCMGERVSGILGCNYRCLGRQIIQDYNFVGI